MTRFGLLGLFQSGHTDDAMTLKLPYRKTPLQLLAQRAMVGVCAVLALGVIGSVAVRGSQPDESPRHVASVEKGMGAISSQSMLAAEDVLAGSTDDLSISPVRFVSNMASDTAMGTLAPSRGMAQRERREESAKASTAVAAAIKTGTVHIRVIRMEVTAYCPCKICCGPKAQGITASGKRVDYNHGMFVAADTNVLPFGTKLLIPGYSGAPVEVIDRGGAIKGNKLDVFFPTHQQALEWGRRFVMVTVIE
jgi:3D (Asp-Asp-Asp) domain-containing protein